MLASLSNITNELINLTDLYDDLPNDIDGLIFSQYIILGWIALTLCLIGIIGNLITFQIFSKFKTKTSTITFMKSLSIVDIIQLILMLFLIPLRYLLVSHMSLNYYEFHTISYPYLYPITTITQFSSIYLIVATTISRVVQL